MIVIAKKTICLLILFLPFLLIGQNTYKIFQDDNFYAYFKTLGKQNGYYPNIDNIIDTLPDGIYIFYDVCKKDSMSRNKNIILSGEYKNRKKNGRFEETSYVFNKKENKYIVASKHISNYISGLKNGIEEKYFLFYFIEAQFKAMEFYGEYTNGKKNGLFMYFIYGDPQKIEMFESDNLKNILFDVNAN